MQKPEAAIDRVRASVMACKVDTSLSIPEQAFMADVEAVLSWANHLERSVEAEKKQVKAPDPSAAVAEFERAAIAKAEGQQ